jgi:hypothetical protein
MKKRVFILAALLAALTVAALPGCSTNTQGDSASPVFLTGEFTLLPVGFCVNANVPLQFSTTTLRNRVKNPTVTSTLFLDVQIDQYVVVWKRVDGGKTASPSQTFPGNIIVPANGTSSLTNYIFMSPDDLIRPPLDQLFPFNGGVDKETGRAEIRQSGNVTWYGHTLSGQPVVSDEATFGMIFTFCGSAGRIEAKRAQ